MDVELTASLAIVEDELHNLHRDLLLALLRPGVPARAVRRELAAQGLASSVELEAIYGWHNGTADGGLIGDVCVFPNFFFISLEEARANYDAFVADPRWKKGWWPVFADGGGDFYVIDHSPGGRGQVRHFWLEQQECPVEFESLTNMMETIAEAMTTGVISVGTLDALSMDYGEFSVLAARLNPSIDWWRD